MARAASVTRTCNELCRYSIPLSRDISPVGVPRSGPESCQASRASDVSLDPEISGARHAQLNAPSWCPLPLAANRNDHGEIRSVAG